MGFPFQRQKCCDFWKKNDMVGFPLWFWLRGSDVLSTIILIGHLRSIIHLKKCTSRLADERKDIKMAYFERASACLTMTMQSIDSRRTGTEIIVIFHDAWCLCFNTIQTKRVASCKVVFFGATMKSILRNVVYLVLKICGCSLLVREN